MMLLSFWEDVALAFFFFFYQVCPCMNEFQRSLWNPWCFFVFVCLLYVRIFLFFFLSFWFITVPFYFILMCLWSSLKLQLFNELQVYSLRICLLDQRLDVCQCTRPKGPAFPLLFSLFQFLKVAHFSSFRCKKKKKKQRGNSCQWLANSSGGRNGPGSWF